jgi:spore maturation protein CgeB
MPLVFAASKINLNISVKGIRSGMPQRTLDVMASGGFLLSNYQMELGEYFREGEEMAMYTGMEDAVEKCGFYLQHEDLRRDMAKKGQARVWEEYNMTDKIGNMLKTASVIA